MNDEELNEAPAADLALLRQPESETLELLSRSDATAIGRTVCAFLNGQGGKVLVGMEENGRVRGVPRAAEAVQAVQKDIFSRIQPPATCAVSVLPAEGHELLLLEVARGADGPYTYADVIYIRTGTATRKANHDNVISLVRQLENAPRWETRPYLGCQLTDLDKTELRQTADEANKRRYANLPADPERLLDSLYLLRAGALTNAAVALFARDAARFLPQTRVRVVHFADESREKILDNKTFTGHIFSLQAQLLAFLQASLPVQASLRTEDFVREESIAYPLAAVREGLVNALVHRDYSRVDGSISLSIYPRRLEIWNAGGLPEGVTFQNLREGGISRPRNPDLAQVLMIRGLIERLGIGGRRMVEACKDAGLPAPQWQERTGGVLLTFRLPEAGENIEKNKPTREAATLSPRVLGFLATLLPGQRFTAREYQRQAATDVSDRQGRLDLAQMLAAQVAERRGSGQGTYYVRTERGLD